MHNVLLIAKREYLERIRTKSFLVMTVLIPLLMGGLVYGAAMMNGRAGTTDRTWQSCRRTRSLPRDLKTELEREKHGDVEGRPADA